MKLFGWLPQARWKRWLILGAIAGALLVVALITLVVTVVVLWRTPRVQQWVMVRVLSHQVQNPEQPPPSPSLSNAEATLLLTNASGLQAASDLYRRTNVWDVQLKFSSNQWAQLGPKAIPPVAHFMRPDGSIILRNPKASRNGLAGVFGLDLPWSHAEVEFGDLAFHEVATRFKGNGTFVNSERSYKRPFKVELRKHGKGHELAGRATLNFHNLTADASCLRDTLAYELFRNAGVPAPRTCFARLRLTIEGQFENRLLGLYVMVENPDAEWAVDQFHLDDVALFKPVTYELFSDLGPDWQAYEGIYDPKTSITPRQSQRVIALAKLVSHATDREFAAKIGEFIDVDEFARFLACEVLLSNYDGPLSNGQNFLLYLDPQTEKFGFVPWDLDHSWGEFPFVGSLEQRERASIWHPWVGENRFLERMLATSSVRETYRRELDRIRRTLFVPQELAQQVNELAPIVRPFIAEESARRLARFERETADRRVDQLSATNAPNASGRRPGYSLKRFFFARSQSVAQQLDGTAEGIILGRRSGR